MAKFLIRVGYTAEGLKGLIKDKGTGRQAAIKKAVSSAGGKLKSLYWALGEDDAIAIVDFPDVEGVAALSMSISASGLVRTNITRLLTAEEVDAAVGKTVNYRPPGK